MMTLTPLEIRVLAFKKLSALGVKGSVSFETDGTPILTRNQEHQYQRAIRNLSTTKAQNEARVKHNTKGIGVQTMKYIHKMEAILDQAERDELRRRTQECIAIVKRLEREDEEERIAELLHKKRLAHQARVRWEDEAPIRRAIAEKKRKEREADEAFHRQRQNYRDDNARNARERPKRVWCSERNRYFWEYPSGV